MEFFDIVVFNMRRAAWEDEHPNWYSFKQTHEGQPEMYLSRGGHVEYDIPIPKWPISASPLELPPVLLCDTISELYEKIDKLWAEQRYTADSFLIKYNDEHNYPYTSVIRIKNLNDNGYDYTLCIWAQFDGDEIIIGVVPW
jgi:hypothetical protein